MTLIEMYKKMAEDHRVDFLKTCLVYDPTKQDYIPATGYAVREDGAVILQTPD